MQRAILRPVKRKIAYMLFLLALFYSGLVAVEVWFAWIQHGKVKEHLKAFNATERRVNVAARLGVSLCQNGRWYQVTGTPLPYDWPVGTHPHRNVIGFKEVDGWPVHYTDKHGFFNRDEWWTDAKVLIVGDSFVSCQHLQASNSLTAILNDRGVKAVTFGLIGSGPYMELAAIRCYWPMLSNTVRTVVWCYYEGNDVQDTHDEAPVYSAVLDPYYTWTPNPQRLDELPSEEWKVLYGWRYILGSVSSLSRTRRVISYARGSERDMQLYQLALDQAIREVKPARFLVVRICKPGAKMDKQWSAIHAPNKFAMPNDRRLYSGGIETAHYTVYGYKVLAGAIQDWINNAHN